MIRTLGLLCMYQRTAQPMYQAATHMFLFILYTFNMAVCWQKQNKLTVTSYPGVWSLAGWLCSLNGAERGWSYTAHEVGGKNPKRTCLYNHIIMFVIIAAVRRHDNPVTVIPIQWRVGRRWVKIGGKFVHVHHLQKFGYTTSGGQSGDRKRDWRSGKCKQPKRESEWKSTECSNRKIDREWFMGPPPFLLVL